MYDVVIIGAGVIGASVARELARYKAKVLVLERENDVGNVTSMANSAIVHYFGKNKPWRDKYRGILDCFYKETKNEVEEYKKR